MLGLQIIGLVLFFLIDVDHILIDQVFLLSFSTCLLQHVMHSLLRVNFKQRDDKLLKKVFMVHPLISPIKFLVEEIEDLLRLHFYKNLK